MLDSKGSCCRGRNASLKRLQFRIKTTSEKLRMIEQLEEPDKQALFRMIDCMLT
jgi:hypothetical protein